MQKPKAELGTITQAGLDIPIGLLRNRVGMPGLSMAEVNSNPDTYIADQYPKVPGGHKGLLLEIRRAKLIVLHPWAM